MGHRSKLQIFAVQHPNADLAIVRDMNALLARQHRDVTGDEEPVQIIWQTRIIACYSRRRDAWRALKASGYTVEGAFWRIRPAQERDPHPLSLPECAE